MYLFVSGVGYATGEEYLICGSFHNATCVMDACIHLYMLL